MHLWWGDSFEHCILSALYLWWNASFVWWIFGMMYLRYAASLVPCIFGVMHPCSDASLAGCIFGVIHLLWAAYDAMHLWCAEYLVLCIFVVLHLWCVANLVNYIFIAIWTTSSVPCIVGAMYNYMHFRYALESLVCWIIGALQLWWIISWLQYFFGVMYLRCVASLVLCIYMHFWYAMHRHLWWCLVGAMMTIVQCIFGALLLGLGSNIFLVLHLWAMHCQLYRTGLLPQWRIYFMVFNSTANLAVPNILTGAVSNDTL